MAKNCQQFELLFKQYLEESGSKLNWGKINPPREGMVRHGGEKERGEKRDKKKRRGILEEKGKRWQVCEKE